VQSVDLPTDEISRLFKRFIKL